MKLLIAARLSQLADGQTGLDTQDLESTAWAEREGHEVVHVAMDRKTGTSPIWDRKNLRPWVTEDARLARYDSVLAYRFDRLSRGDDEETSAIETWARKHGKQLLTVDGLVFPCEGADGIRWDVVKRIAHEEWLKTSERYRRMQDYLRANDKLVGKPSYGFAPGPADGGHKTMVPVPAEAQAIRQAASRYLAGDSLRTVCRWLDAEGVHPRTWTEDKPITWSPASLAQVFRNSSLIGRRMSEPVKDKETGRVIRPARLLLTHDPILDRDVWDRLQAELDRKANRLGVAPRDTALLTGVAVCDKCDGPLYRITCGGPRNRSPFYRCHGDERHPSTCRNLVPLSELDGWVDHDMRANGAFVIETVVTPGVGYDAEISDTETDLHALDWDAPDFIDRQSALLAERARLRPLPNKPAVVDEKVAPYAVGDLWGWLSPAERRAYLLASGVKVRAAGRVQHDRRPHPAGRDRRVERAARQARRTTFTSG